MAKRHKNKKIRKQEKSLSCFSGVGELGHTFRLGPLEDGWQRNLSLNTDELFKFGPANACISILSQEMARIPIEHYRMKEDGTRELVTNKAPIRIFRKPNLFQSKSDFILYMMRALLTDGNAYAVAFRNERNEIAELLPVSPRNMWPYIVEGNIFYGFSDGVVQDIKMLENVTWFPQRDVLHLRMFCPRHPLIGESPITAAYYPALTGMEINKHNANFFHNMSRPSGVLRHPGTLNQQAMDRIKDKFMEITQRGHTGEPIVLQENMEWKPLTMTAVDAELVNSFRLTERQVAQVYRIPPFLLGDLEKATFQNVESLSRFFVSSSLGFYIDHWEEAFKLFFDLPPNETILFDIETALLRGDLKERMEAYAKGVQNGVLAPNEARKRENLPPREYGDEPRVQQQLVPLQYGMNMQPPSLPAPAAPQAGDDEESEPSEEQMEAARIVALRAIKRAMAA